jgi:hypothetical protein
MLHMTATAEDRCRQIKCTMRYVSLMYIFSPKLYDPEAYCLVSNLPTKFSYKVMLWPWPLTLKKNTLLPLIIVIKCTKLWSWNCCSASLLPTWYGQTTLCHNMSIFYGIIKNHMHISNVSIINIQSIGQNHLTASWWVFHIKTTLFISEKFHDTHLNSWSLV